ncbi:SigE family RNA polymerase sigma factor [Nocardioides sp. MAH-18]|uniref:SigE family RNA polymerase sigma factor n=1 Tax=Nocardioides agri TaxID=2682843 RepID=A0A6L6XXL9_9ACTN|nr:SigE family RNA polymerase sigma factor [Nocardioides sp. CGMCC 1.13656]MBA2952281.1 SigE family RNA polymerase sigma factor [Nocardioides sp. CGMCC 1.13656]MVQ51443.1 SigE family RNA polymerase sigma factor [Nocardioides sp. MAH-18]
MTAEQEFDEFAIAAWPRLRRSAYLLTGDHHLAEDLAQTALARTYASWQRVRRADALAYARKVMVNANIDRLRRRRATEVGGAAAESRLAREPVADVGSEELASDRDAIVRLLGRLTDRERRVVVLRHYFDLSEAQVARELGIAPGTVKSALSRALGKLRVTAAEDETTFVREGLR